MKTRKRGGQRNSRSKEWRDRSRSIKRAQIPAERVIMLGWLLVQRFGYRQVMYWVMFESVFTAIGVDVVGWGKLERKATVEAKA